MMLKNIRTYVLCILSMKYFLRENSSCCLLIRILHILASLRVTCHVSAARDTWHVRCYLSTRGKIGNRCKKCNKYGASGLLTTVSVSIVTDESRIVVGKYFCSLRSFIHSHPSFANYHYYAAGLWSGAQFRSIYINFSLHIAHNRESPSWIIIFCKSSWIAEWKLESAMGTEIHFNREARSAAAAVAVARRHLADNVQ